ncbi:hypothetical protein A0H81_04088 [Grifola frondosa]|uniref:Uncharacterized protein n=1 Tax=Grifola frondosa TaxID=5627 RepID=A0A1C7ML70_GRIFR|nr:hypothetical protein A0H81_04088 [Grifola frondosa]
MRISCKRLSISSQALEEQLKKSVISFSMLDSLRSHINCIYRHVSMRYESGPEMIMDTILLAVAEMSADDKVQTPVAIFPEMRLTSEDGVATIVFTHDSDYEPARVLQATVEDIARFARNRITLMEAKRDAQQLYDCMPEATS